MKMPNIIDKNSQEAISPCLDGSLAPAVPWGSEGRGQPMRSLVLVSAAKAMTLPISTYLHMCY